MKSLMVFSCSLVFLFVLSAQLEGQTAEDACSKGTWANCGMAVKKELDKAPPAQRTVELALLWEKAYDARFNELRRSGKLERSTPDSEKIYEAVKEKLNPIEIAKDKAKEELLKKYLPRLAPLMKWAGGPIGTALQAFFNSSEIATDYDELRLMNNDLQELILKQLSPLLKPDWNAQLRQAVEAAGPQLRMP